MKFVDAKSDIAFKKIFGNENHKEILIGFLNALLGLEGDRCITDITLKNPWQAPDIPILKESTLDIKAVDGRNVEFIVEMQVRESGNFGKRATYYTSKAYSSQIDKGEDYPKLHQVIFIGILNFNIFDDSEDKHYLSQHLILNKDTFKHELKDLEFHFVELCKFKLKEKDAKTVLEKWIYFIKNVKNLDMIPESVEGLNDLKEAYNQACKNAWSKKELEVYDYWSMKEADIRYEKELAEAARYNEGIEIGKLEGKLEVARNLKLAGVAVELIMTATDLTSEEIERV